MTKIQWSMVSLMARALARPLRTVFSLSAQVGFFVFTILFVAALLSNLTAAPLFPAMGGVVADAMPVEPGTLTRPVMSPLVDAIIATLISLSTLLLYKVSNVAKNYVSRNRPSSPADTPGNHPSDRAEKPSSADGQNERPYSDER